MQEAKCEVMIHVGGKDLVAEIPAVFKALVEALPLIYEFFNGGRYQVFEATNIHARVGGAYKFKQWLGQVIDKNRLVEGKDYWTVELDVNDPANAQAAMRDARRRPSVTYFTPQAARKVVTRSDTDEGHLLYDYIDAVAEAATPALLKYHAANEAAINAKLGLAQEQHRNVLDNTEQQLAGIAKHLGYKNVSLMDKALAAKSTAHDINAEVRDEDLVAPQWKNLARRTIIKAKAHLERKEYKELAFVILGAYDDMKRADTGGEFHGSYEMPEDATAKLLAKWKP